MQIQDFGQVFPDPGSCSIRVFYLCGANLDGNQKTGLMCFDHNPHCKHFIAGLYMHGFSVPPLSPTEIRNEGNERCVFEDEWLVCGTASAFSCFFSIEVFCDYTPVINNSPPFFGTNNEDSFKRQLWNFDEQFKKCIKVK